MLYVESSVKSIVILTDFGGHFGLSSAKLDDTVFLAKVFPCKKSQKIWTFGPNPSILSRTVPS